MSARKPGSAVRSIINGMVVDPGRNTARKAAILIKHDRIEHVDFTNKKPYIKDRVHDARGCFIIPAFSDSHTHLLAHGIELQRVDLSVCSSSDDCLDRLRDRVRGAGAEVFGVNWDESAWDKGSVNGITRQVLDKLTKAVPVVMRRVCGHFAIGNSRAIDMIPRHWRIVDRGRGYLYEDASLYLNEIFKPSPHMLEKGLELATDDALSRGVTSVHEIVRPEFFRVYQALRSRLRIRVAIYLQEGLELAAAAGLSTGLGDDMLKFAGVKYYLDGSIGARTAALSRPYNGTKNRGKLLMNAPKLAGIIRKAEAGNIQVMLHAIGDRTARMIVQAFGSCELGLNRLRHRVEHLEYVDEPTVKKISKMGLVLSLQPNFVARWQGPDGMYEKAMGERYRHMNCFRLMEKTGLQLMFGSDSMPLDPLFGLGGAVNHPFECGRLSPARALYGYTRTGPYATFDEAKKGMIAPGYFADLALLDGNPLDKQSIGSMRVRAVFLAGKIAYSRDDARRRG